MNKNFKNIFLIDSLGACLSFLLAFFIFPPYSEVLGVSKYLLYVLGSIALTYTLYSLCIYKLIQKIKSWMLLLLIILNTSYCIGILSILVLHTSITSLGTMFFITEALVIFILVTFEIKTLIKFQ